MKSILAIGLLYIFNKFVNTKKLSLQSTFKNKAYEIQQNKKQNLNYFMPQAQSNEIYYDIKKEFSSESESEESKSDSLSDSSEDSEQFQKFV